MMISIIAKLVNDVQIVRRFLWSIEDSFPVKTTLEKEVEILFWGEKPDFNIDTRIRYDIYGSSGQDWENMVALSEKAAFDIIVFSDIRIVFTEEAFRALSCKFDPKTVRIPKIISQADNRIMDYGATAYKNKLIYLHSGLLYDSDVLQKEYQAITGSNLVIAVSKSLFLNFSVGVNNFDELYEKCRENDVRVIADGDFIVYCDDKINLPQIYHGKSMFRNDFVSDALLENFSRLNKKFVAKDYLFINISKDGLAKKVISVLNGSGEQIISVISEYDCGKKFSGTNVDLFHALPLEFLNYHTALIYYVSSIKAITENSLWFSARDIEFDLVIDSNLNVMHAFEIANRLV